jgi:putative protein kinase ArgK-like GTPase of G3E family
MNSKHDLTTASRQTLIRVIAAQEATMADQQALIAQLQARIEVLKGKAKAGGLKGMPGNKHWRS